MISAISLLFFERVEGTMWIIRNRRSTNDRQNNGQKKKNLLARNQDNVSESNDKSMRVLLLH